MSLTLKVTEAEPPKLIPVGIYNAILKDFSEGEGGFGPYMKFNFEISDGDQHGVVKNVIASKKLTKANNGKNSKLYSILVGLLGRQLENGEEVDFNGLIGKKCQIFVKNDKLVGDVQYQSVVEVLPIN